MVDDIPARGCPGSRTNSQHQKSSLTSVTRFWTPARVEERLREAVAMRAELMAERLPGEIASSGDPEGIGTIGGIGADDVAGVTEALSWLRWLEPDEAALVVSRIEGASWKSICWRFGISRPTADRRWRYALALIAWHLNGHGRTEPKPSLRSLLGMRRACQVTSRSSQPKR